jgi:hypothetical protein
MGGEAVKHHAQPLLPHFLFFCVASAILAAVCAMRCSSGDTLVVAVTHPLDHSKTPSPATPTRFDEHCPGDTLFAHVHFYAEHVAGL